MSNHSLCVYFEVFRAIIIHTFRVEGRVYIEFRAETDDERPSWDESAFPSNSPVPEE